MKFLTFYKSDTTFQKECNGYPMRKAVEKHAQNKRILI